jgi:hypothetical protein
MLVESALRVKGRASRRHPEARSARTRGSPPRCPLARQRRRARHAFAGQSREAARRAKARDSLCLMRNKKKCTREFSTSILPAEPRD